MANGNADEIEIRLAHLCGPPGGTSLPPWAEPDPRCRPEEVHPWEGREDTFEQWDGLKIWLAPDLYPYDPDARFALVADHATSAAVYVSNRPRPAGLDVTLDIVKLWIRRCDTQHASCGVTNAGGHAPSEMPRRLLSLSSSDIYPNIRVMEVSTPRRYIALSYCWGGGAEAAKQVKTRRASIADHQDRVSTQSLPQTIQDAVRVARALGIDYLWVDALCIVQDDDEDKNHEIARMGVIYTNAYLTLSASGASHCAEGFLDRPLTDYRDCDFFEVPLYRYKDSGPCAVKLSPLGGRNIWAKEYGNNLIFQGRELLHTRGWTFQETFLSPRMLIYSSLQPYWVCHEAFWSCGDPDAIDYLQNVSLSGSLELRKDFVTNSPIRSWPWAVVVQEFSSRQLTFLEDKPLALHAVRESFETQYDHLREYALGLFSSSAHVDLLWHSRYGAEPRKRLQGFPSWSWMSFDGGVSYHHQYAGTREDCIKRQEYFEVVTWPACDHFGRISPNSPLLKLAGMTKEVAIPHRFWKDGRASSQDMPCSSTYVLQLQSEDEEDEIDRIGHITFDEYRMPNSGEDFDDNPPSRYKCFECLLLTLERRDAEGGDISGSEEADGDYKGSFGLIIAPVPESAGKYLRIGFFKGRSNSVSYFDSAVRKECTLV